MRGHETRGDSEPTGDRSIKRKMSASDEPTTMTGTAPKGPPPLPRRRRAPSTPLQVDPPPIDGERSFAELPLEMQKVALDRARRMKAADQKFFTDRKKLAIRLALIAPAIYLFASLFGGATTAAYWPLIAIAGVAAGFTVARSELSGLFAAAVFGGTLIGTQILAMSFGLFTVTPRGFFTWILVAVIGKFIGDAIESAGEGF